ncbi:uncharacterized protein LOC126272335 isoform X2 [Schistocerca gregaria]|uniref:uncharacterized protein LOC126272335 isoform X2 n=1 Tax=Schistocerca gregaria TaxID=7010 RepID=UPI00211E0056|nr:uncharacterized protein LOC126272335 isoform X2 [Schistocerca gregaria]XP_049831075.1 uncharacterized protein LOC126272335 isoform X2 [Schistocerca gregaria]
MALDARWLQIVAIGMVLHITNSCVIGFCGDMGLKRIEPDFESSLFTLATLNLLTTQNLCPGVVASANPIVARLFEIAASIFIVDVALVTIWQPGMKFISAIPPFIGSVVQCVATSLCMVDTAPVQWLLSILADERTCNDSILVAAILLVVYSAKSSNFICHMRNLLEEKTSGSPPCPCPGEDGGKQRSRKRSRSRSRVRRDLSVSTFETDD